MNCCRRVPIAWCGHEQIKSLSVETLREIYIATRRCVAYPWPLEPWPFACEQRLDEARFVPACLAA